MPNQKVPQLPILTAITDADLFYVVDVSDTTDDPTGSSKQVTREEILTNISYLDFNTTATTAHLEGRVRWNDNIKSLEVDTENSGVQVQVGHEMVVRVNNQTGSILTKGTVVYINGEQGQRPTVTKADYSGDSSSASVIGLVAADINNNNNGYVITQGILEGLNTVAYPAGTSLYLFTGGTYSSNKPQAPDHDVRIGKVIVSNATTGSIYVNVQNGYELDELHDVRITSVSENDVLVRSSYNGTPVWVNTKTISGLTYVGATTISATTYQNLPPDLWTQNGSSIYYNGGNVGIGESNPTRKFEVLEGSGLAYFNLTGTSGPAAVVVTTDLTKLSRFIASDGTNSISVGMRTSGETANPGFGGQNDAFIYVNTSANGLNIINAQTTGVNSDYIRLYAGLIPTQGISHLHVQGSGSTKGFIGINNENPIARLHISGNTLIDGVLSATTISATTYQNLPIDPNFYTTAFTYSNNVFTIKQTGQSDLTATINSVTGWTVNGNQTVTGNTSLQGVTATTASISGSGQNVLTVTGSGNSTSSPIFKVIGSQGELFSVTDSLTGLLQSVNNISGLPIWQVYSDNTILMGTYLAPSLNTTVKVSLTAGTNTVYSIPTSAYTGGFFDYTVISSGATGARAGTVMSIWSGTTAEYTDVSTNDIGNTSGISFSVAVSGGNSVLSCSATTTGWTLKTIVRSI